MVSLVLISLATVFIAGGEGCPLPAAAARGDGGGNGKQRGTVPATERTAASGH